MEFKPTKKQREAIRHIICGKNAFLTGPAGTGKSYVLKYYIEWFKENKENNNNKIYITSTTGLSALLIDGITIHRYSGIGIVDTEIEKDFIKIMKMKTLKKRWCNTSVLIIDEISMMNAQLFDKLEYLARKIRRNEEPFGGIQIILSGDFLQIPPVKSENFCFEASKWNIIDKTFYFDEILRQNDDILQSVLNNVRLGIVTNDVKTLLDSCLNKELHPINNIEPTLLFSKKNMVITYNQKRLNDLIKNGKENYIFESSYQFSDDKISNHNMYRDMLNNQFQTDDNLHLSINSQVMLTINMPELNLSNGSRGIIIDFTKDSDHYPIVLFDDGKVLKILPNNYTIDEDRLIITKQQIPLMLSWAITIHKAQGMTLDYIKTDIGNSIFEYGQAYVVLSRIKNIEGLSLINIDYSKIKSHPKILKYYENLKNME